MAHRDRSQGFGFVYSDIDTLLKQREGLNPKSSQMVNFNKDPSPQESDESTRTLSQIKSNLDRLQSLHHKLHAVLEELNQITTRKKHR